MEGLIEDRPDRSDVRHLQRILQVLSMLARMASSFEDRLDLLIQAHYFVGRIVSMVSETGNIGNRLVRYQEAMAAAAAQDQTPSDVTSSGGGGPGIGVAGEKPTFEQWLAAEEDAHGGKRLDIFAAPRSLSQWGYWRPCQALCQWMKSPPGGREMMVISPSTVGKVPILVHHLASLSELMSSQGLAAHAVAPLALCEAVVRLCLCPGSSKAQPGSHRAQTPGGSAATLGASSSASTMMSGGGDGSKGGGEGLPPPALAW
ncbi:unnamed protein product, partial [Discosporangium mesarthrocarpum]